MTREEAVEIARKWMASQASVALANDGKRQKPKLWSIDTNMDHNSILETIRGPLSPPELHRFSPLAGDVTDDPPEWAFFVDEYPDANWEHPCKYVFIHASGDVTSIKETAPPSGKPNYVMIEVTGF